MTTLYKFLTEDGRGTHSRYQWPLPKRGEDGQWQPGKWVEVAGDLIVCENAIHACRAEDCLNWLGPRLYTIAFRDDTYLLHADDPDESKVYGRAARLLAPVETWNDRTIRLFACDCAERVLPIYERETPGDSRPREAIAVARRFADGQARREELSAARSAARSAAWEAARSAALEAAWAAARSAARSAAWEAARSAARSAAREAAWEAARSAARSAAWEAARSAAWEAAWAAAWAAERAWQTSRFLAYVNGEVQ